MFYYCYWLFLQAMKNSHQGMEKFLKFSLKYLVWTLQVEALGSFMTSFWIFLLSCVFILLGQKEKIFALDNSVATRDMHLTRMETEECGSDTVQGTADKKRSRTDGATGNAAFWYLHLLHCIGNFPNIPIGTASITQGYINSSFVWEYRSKDHWLLAKH